MDLIIKLDYTLETPEERKALVEKILEETSNESEEARLFSYMLFPNYYFDLLKEDIDKKNFNEIIKKVKKY